MAGIVGRPGLIVGLIVGVAGLAYLGEDGVAVSLLEPLKKQVDLRGRLAAVVKAVYPEGSKLRRRGLRQRGGERRDDEDQSEDEPVSHTPYRTGFSRRKSRNRPPAAR